MAASTTTIGYAATSPRVRLNRALGAGAATAAALAVWAIAVPVLGVHLLIRFGTGAAQTVSPGLVVAASLMGSLLGWGLLVALERRTSRARSIWTAVAIVALLVSLSLPLSVAITPQAKVLLSAMHVAVAGVLIVTLRRTAAR